MLNSNQFQTPWEFLFFRRCVQMSLEGDDVFLCHIICHKSWTNECPVKEEHSSYDFFLHRSLSMSCCMYIWAHGSIVVTQAPSWTPSCDLQALLAMNVFVFGLSVGDATFNSQIYFMHSLCIGLCRDTPSNGLPGSGEIDCADTCTYTEVPCDRECSAGLDWKLDRIRIIDFVVRLCKHIMWCSVGLCSMERHTRACEKAMMIRMLRIGS